MSDRESTAASPSSASRSGSGRGADGRLTEEPIDVAELRQRVADPAAGAVATFEGVVRDHHRGRAVDRLEYEAYAPMVEAVFREVVEEAVERWPLRRVAVRHRVGDLAVGEVAVAVAVSADHRAEAFEACRYLIDRIKARAPIWKKEFGPDGSRWVEGSRGASSEEPDGPSPEDETRSRPGAG